MKKGISLIVLVITIIVMIILASTAIISLNNGILKNAELATSKTSVNSLQVIATSAWAEGYIAGYRTQGNMEAHVLNRIRDNGLTDDEINKKYSILVTAKEATVNQSVYKYVDNVPIPNGFTASDLEGENTKAGGLVIYEGADKVSSDVDARTTRDQFVWVPVDNFDNFVRTAYYSNTLTEQITDNPVDVAEGRSYQWEVVLDDENMPVANLESKYSKYISSETLREAQLMYASVKTHKGFYISRYEVSNINGKPASIKNVMPWCNIAREGTSGAINTSRGMYKYDSDVGVVSSLIYGVQWDAVMYWMKDIDNENYNDKFVFDSRGMGSYKVRLEESNGMEFSVLDLINTGDDMYKVNNIYDLAGNAIEMTMETYRMNTIGRHTGAVARGGSIDVSREYEQAFNRVSKRDFWDVDGTQDFIGFRIALYIK